MRNKTCVNLEEIILDVHPSVTFKQFQPSCQMIGTTWGTPSGNYSNELSQHTEPWAIENKSLLCAIKFCGVQVIDNQKIIVIKQHWKPKCIEDLLYSRHDTTVRYTNIKLFNSPATLWHVHHNFIFSKQGNVGSENFCNLLKVIQMIRIMNGPLTQVNLNLTLLLIISIKMSIVMSLISIYSLQIYWRKMKLHFDFRFCTFTF